MPITRTAKDGEKLDFPDGTSEASIQTALQAHADPEGWGGLGGKVLDAVGAVVKAYDQGQELQGRGLMLRNTEDAIGKLQAQPATLAGMAYGEIARLADPSRVRSDWGNNSVQYTNVPPPFLLPDSALTLGNAQLYSPQKPPERVIRSPYTGATMRAGDHEERHAQGWQEEGPAYLLKWLRGGGISNSNPLEIEADRYGVEKLRRGGR